MLRSLPKRLALSHASSSQEDLLIDMKTCIKSLSELAVKIRNPVIAVSVGVRGKRQRNEIRVAANQGPLIVVDDDDDTSGQSIFCIGSIMKVFIAFVFCKVITEQETPTSIGWDKDACGLYNSLCGEGEQMIENCKCEPTIAELLLHQKAFPEINRVLMAPDGTFMVTEDLFLRHIPALTNDASPYKNPDSVLYSSANYIFAAVILEKLMDSSLEEIMKDYIFVPFGMTRTTTSRAQFDAWKSSACHNVLPGHRVSGDLRRCEEAPPNNYMDTSIAAACFGTWSCTDDLAAFFGGIIEALGGDTKAVSREVAEAFFSWKIRMGDECYSTFAGLRCDINSEWLGRDSLNDSLGSKDSPIPRLYTLGKFHDTGTPTDQKIYHKGGIVDGFTSQVYLAPEHKLFVIVLTNSTGPIDFASHAGQAVLQELLSIKPPVPITDLVTQNLSVLCKTLADLEAEDANPAAWPDPIAPFVGRYKNYVYNTKLEISEEGKVVFKSGETICSGTMLVRAKGLTMRLFPGQRGFVVDRLAENVWRDLRFRLGELKGKKGLRGGEGERNFWVRLLI